MFYDVKKVDVGINKQKASNEVVWSDGLNVRFTEGWVSKTKGKRFLSQLKRQVGTVISNDQSPVMGIYPYTDPGGNSYTFIITTNRVYRVNKDFTSILDYSFTGQANWTGVWSYAVLGGLPLLVENSNGYPLYLPYNGSSFIPLDSAIRVGLGVVHKRRWVTVGISSSPFTTAFRARMSWSDIMLPSSTITTASSQAGYIDLVDPNGGPESQEGPKRAIVAGERLFIFGKNVIWEPTEAEHPIVYAPKPFIYNVALISGRAIAQPPREKDGVVRFMAKDDFYELSAEGLHPLPNDLRNYIYSVINLSAPETSFFAFRKASTKEDWFCCPTGTSLLPDKAFIYNYELKNWTIGKCNFLSYGEHESSTGVISIVGDYLGRIYELDSGDTEDQEPIEFFLESGDTCIERQGGGFYKSYEDVGKYINSLIPRLLEQDPDNILYIEVGTRNSLQEPIRWSQPYEFRIGVTPKAYFREYGKYFKVRFSNYQKNSPFSLGGYQIDYTLGGQR